MPRRELITREELSALVGASGTRNFQKWERAGLPYIEKRIRKGGRAAHLYDRRKALAWLKAHASAGISSRSKQELDRLDGKKPPRGESAAGPPPAPPPAVAATDGGADDAELGSVWESILRIREDEELWAREMREAMRDGDIIKAAKCEECRSKLAKLQVDLYAQYVDLQERRGELVSAEEAAGDYAKVLSSVRNNILGVPDSAMPSLIPHLRDPNEADDVKAMLTGYVHDALRAIAATDVFGEELARRDGAAEAADRKGVGGKRRRADPVGKDKQRVGKDKA